MIVNGGVNPYDSHRFGFGYIDTIQRQRFAANSQNRISASDERETSVEAFKQVMRIRQAVQAINPLMLGPEEIQVSGSAKATSAESLDIIATPTSTTVQSTEEVNATPTSYSTHGPDWSGSSTAQVTISGEYDGSNGTDTLTFKANKFGTHGTHYIQLTVYDSNNNEIDRVDIGKFDPIDQQYTLSNGLVLTLGEGVVKKDDTFTLQVFDSIGSVVDPSKPLNGTRNDDPNLEGGLSVSDGSFQVNGTTIAVNAADSINSVLDRINQSDAGVTATFDAATETVLLTQKTPGAGQDIVLENDNSGFLAAVKLDGATPTPGQDPDTEKLLAEVDSFSIVQSGSISINGVSIDIDVNTDSLNDILDRISASEAGVTASFDSASSKVSLNSDTTNTPLIVAGGATNFFSAVGIMDGTYEATDSSIEAYGVKVGDVTKRIVESIVEENSEKPWEQNLETAPAAALDTGKLSTLVNNMADAMNALFDDSAFKGSPGGFLEGVRSDIRAAVSSWFGSEGPQFETDFGIRFNFEKADKGVFNFSQTEQNRFEVALADPEGANSIRNALFGQESNGLFTQLHATLTAAATAFEKDIDPTGLFLNVSI